MITLTEEEARTLVSSYAWLMELADEHGFEMRPEEYRLYEKVNGSLEISAVRRDLGFTDQVRPRVIPPPPPSRYEEDEYDPT